MTSRAVRRLRIHGRVQGVWFRESMRQEAQKLQIAGWVRNRIDGTVEAAVEGPAEAVEAMIVWAWKGPELAEVTGIDVTDDPGSYSVFEKLPTA